MTTALLAVLIGALAYTGIQLAEIRRALSAPPATSKSSALVLITELLATIEANQRQHAIAILSGIGAILKTGDPTARHRLVKLRAGLGEIFVARFKDFSPETAQSLDEQEAYAKFEIEALERYGSVFQADALDYAYNQLDLAVRQRPEDGLPFEAHAKAFSRETLDERLASIKKFHARKTAKGA